MKTRGVSLVESIMALAVIALLAAIVTPIYGRVVQGGHIHSSLDRLRQLHVAVMLYQSDFDVSGAQSSSLPPYGYVYTSYLGFGRNFFKSPCGYKEGIESNLLRLSYGYSNDGPLSDKYYAEYKENSLLFRDPHCNASSVQWESKYLVKRGLGVLYSGKLVNHNKPGSPIHMSWWSQPPGN